MMPSPCAASSASAISMAIGRSSSAGIRRRSIQCVKVTPSRNSIAIKAMAVFFADIVNRAYVGMVERRSSLSLSPETAKCLRVMSNVLREEFEGDEAMQTVVFGLVHHAHAAAAEFTNDPIMRDRAVDHFEGCKRLIDSRGRGNFRSIALKLLGLTGFAGQLASRRRPRKPNSDEREVGYT